jgi:hypothetical protein
MVPLTTNLIHAGCDSHPTRAGLQAFADAVAALRPPRSRLAQLTDGYLSLRLPALVLIPWRLNALANSSKLALS